MCGRRREGNGRALTFEGTAGVDSRIAQCECCAAVHARVGRQGLAFQRRLTIGGASVSTAGALAAALYRVALERSGDAIAAYASTVGAQWTLVGSDTIAMAADVVVGIAVSSRTTSAAATATFTNVALTAAHGAP
jgi:hypothetical protein